MLERLSPAIAANRFGLGAKPAELTQIGSQPRDWLYAQLSGAAPLLAGPELHSSAETLARGLDVRRELRAAKRAAAEADSDDKANAVAAIMKIGQVYRPIYVAEATARFHQGVTVFLSSCAMFSPQPSTKVSFLPRSQRSFCWP